MLKIAGIQMFADEDKGKNIKKAKELISIAAENGAKIVCLGELFSTRWFPREANKELLTLAEDENGETIRSISQYAKENNIVIISPIFEKDADGKYYNSAFIIDDDGIILGKYRKIHIPQIPLWEEKFYFSPGNLGFPVFKTKYANIGIQICWDNFFPEGSRILALKGAEIIFAPTAAAFATHYKWQTVISANAIVNGIFIFRINRVGKEEKQHFYGKSFCVSPEGELLDIPSGVGEGIVFVTVDFKEINLVRREWSFMKDRREEIYKEILGGGTNNL
jgi:N-carbamoylputrescine amidase